MFRTFLLAGTAAVGLVALAQAVVVISGNYINAGISDDGTLGSNGSMSPGAAA